MVYRDIKPGNVLLLADDYKLIGKVCDLSLVRMHTGSDMTLFAGCS